MFRLLFSQSATLSRRSALAAGALLALSSLILPATEARAQAPLKPDVDMAEFMKPGELPENVMGKEDAPFTIVEYSSMTCPHCARFHKDVLPELKKKYIDTGKAKYVLREFPLDNVAAAAAMLARCAGKEKYFPLIEAFFAQQKDWVVQKPLQPMFAIAKQAGFTQQSFDECLANQRMLNGIEESRTRAASKFNVTSTPTFFINGKIFRGALTVEELDKQVAPYLKG